MYAIIVEKTLILNLLQIYCFDRTMLWAQNDQTISHKETKTRVEETMIGSSFLQQIYIFLTTDYHQI